MSLRKVPLNSAQKEVLAWVRAGSPDGLYTDWSHRVTARALHNRDLIAIQGRGATWSASLTEDGAYYLDHGTHPNIQTDAAEAATEAKTSTLDAQQPEPTRSARTPTTPRRRTAKAQKLGPVDQLMAALEQAEGHQIVVPSSERGRYRQLAGAAKRFGRIPSGMQIAVGWGRPGRSTVALEPVPAWQTAALEPVPVPKRLHAVSDVVSELSESDTFQVEGAPRRRALRLAEALVVAARSRGMAVRARLDQPVNRKYGGRGGARRDEIEVVLDEDRFRVWFTQATLQKPHETTQRELSRVQQGYLFPDFNHVPDEDLGLVLEGEGGTFWADSWQDTDGHQLEQDLAQVLEEIRLRHERLAEQRQAERERHLAQRRQDEEDRARAVEKYRAQFLVDEMKGQAQRWDEAMRLREYADAVRTEAQRRSGDERGKAFAWAELIEAQATKTNPLPTVAGPPAIPEPSNSDLAPFLKSRTFGRSGVSIPSVGAPAHSGPGSLRASAAGPQRDDSWRG